MNRTAFGGLQKLISQGLKYGQYNKASKDNTCF